MPHHLTEDQVREVLSRAEEIHFNTVSAATGSASVESVLQAAEEAGLPREAVEQALRERLDLTAAPPEPGTLAFAKSSDGRFYVSEVISVEPTRIRVKFLKGGEHIVAPTDIKECSLLPGQRIVCPWPDWGWWTCTVISYNAEKRKVKVSDGWGSTESFPIADIRLDPPRAKSPMAVDLRTRLTLLAAGVVSGGAIGAAAMWFLTR